jgi:transcriptional regulator with PAS, ATPase and Fis domain
MRINNKDYFSYQDRGITEFSRIKADFIGKSHIFKSLSETIRKVAQRKCAITMIGETGTGKEVVARQIHQQSVRSDGPFVPVDCTTLTGQLFESQLFGHAKGAFTGATSDTIGFFRAANGGTILLDEISELELNLQAKLLRVLQDSCVVPVGSTKIYPVDVRVISATNKDLKDMVRKGAFRADLYFRLNIVQIIIPPLRERKEDILALANHFLVKQAELYDEPGKRLSEQTKRILLDYDWPGNVRELANVVEQAYVMCKEDVINLSSLPHSVFDGEPMQDASGKPKSLDEVKKNAVIEALSAARGRKTKAARILGISYRKLVRLMNKYALQPRYE